MIMKNYFPLFILSIMFHQAYAMQQPQQTKEKKLKELLNKFDRECELNCSCQAPRESKLYCRSMCTTLKETFENYNKVLSEDKTEKEH